jgi:two-component sensor histidine kinase
LSKVVLSILFLCFAFWNALFVSAQNCNTGELRSKISATSEINLLFDLYKQIGACYMYNDSDSAAYFYNKSLEIANNLNNSDYLGDIYYSLGDLEKTIGNYNESIEYAVKSLNNYGVTNNDEGLINANTLVAHNYALKQNYEKSIQYYNQSIKLSDEIGKKVIKVGSLIGKGNVLFYQGKLDEAMLLFEEAILITEKFNAGDIETKAGLYANTGNIYLNRSAYKEALDKYLKGFNIYSQLNDKYGMSLLSFNISEAYIGMKQYDSALKYCNINLFLGKELESTEEIKYAYRGLTNLYEGKCNFDSAYKYYQLFVKYNDSIKEVQYNTEVETIVNQYQNEKQYEELQVANEKVKQAKIIQTQSERIINLLIVGGIFLFCVLALVFWLYQRTRKANELIREQSKLISLKNKSIDKALAQKDILLKEVHHRVKNNLQIIASLLNLQTMKMENEVTKQAIEDSKSRVQAIALMHKSLYQDEHLNKVDLKGYVNDLVDNQKLLIKQENNQINFNLNVDEIIVSIDDAVPLGLIISELISNSTKHAFTKHVPDPTVYIHIAKTKEVITLVYSDNGVGLSDEFDLFNGESLGYEIITALTDQLQGTIQIISKKPFQIEVKF